MTVAYWPEKVLNFEIRGFRMSRIFCIIDGMTDSGFQVSRYPNLAGMALTRYIDTCQGHAPESLGCILRLLGVKRVPENLRGYAEALGAGIPVGEDDLILRGSWFGTDANGRCTVPIAAPEVLEDLDDCRYYPLEQYKSLLVFPHKASEIHKIRTYPPYVCIGQKTVDLCPEGSPALEAVYRKYCRNDCCLIPWGQSVPAKLPRFPEPAAVVCGTGVVKGIAGLLHMELMDVPGATGDVDTDLEGKITAALRAAQTYPFVLLHINGADEASHRKDLKQKDQFLQRVDRLLPSLLQSGHEISVVSDHGTDPGNGAHMGFPQPMYEACRK